MTKRFICQDPYVAFIALAISDELTKFVEIYCAADKEYLTDWAIKGHDGMMI